MDRTPVSSGMAQPAAGAECTGLRPEGSAAPAKPSPSTPAAGSIHGCGLHRLDAFIDALLEQGWIQEMGDVLLTRSLDRLRLLLQDGPDGDPQIRVALDAAARLSDLTADARRRWTNLLIGAVPRAHTPEEAVTVVAAVAPPDLSDRLLVSLDRTAAARRGARKSAARLRHRLARFPRLASEPEIKTSVARILAGALDQASRPGSPMAAATSPEPEAPATWNGEFQGPVATNRAAAAALLGDEQSGRPHSVCNVNLQLIGSDGTDGDITEPVHRRPEDVCMESDPAHRRARIRRLLEDPDGLHPVFQPIIDLWTGEVVGAEALTRFSASGHEHPESSFEEAWAVGLGCELELLAVCRAVENVPRLPATAYLAVNLSARALLDPRVADLLTDSSVPADRIIVELTEHEVVEDYDRITRSLDPARRVGVRLAVDDTGAGYASFAHILRLRPDAIKLDRTLVTGAGSDPMRRALVAALVGFANSVGPWLIAEGIETPADLAALRHAGVRYAQGYLLGRPRELPLAISPLPVAPVLLPHAPGRQHGSSNGTACSSRWSPDASA